MNTLFETSPAVPELAGTVQFTVYGKPVPQGSSRAFFVKKLGRAVITSANAKLKPWRQMLSDTAQSLGVPIIPKEIPVAMSLDFYFEKPASAPKKRIYPTVKPDTDKLIRSILDSLTGIVYVDDSQVVRFDHIEKHYGVPERCEISVRPV
jgi:Holliday junction resolvase RusA-like endonuclease